jgi:hypothetical protein
MALGMKNSMANHAGGVTSAMGGVVTYTPSGGVATDINGIFQSPYNEQVETETRFASQEFILIVKSTDVTGIAQGDAFTVETVAYTVDNVEVMQTGKSRIVLSKD